MLACGGGAGGFGGVDSGSSVSLGDAGVVVNDELGGGDGLFDSGWVWRRSARMWMGVW